MEALVGRALGEFVLQSSRKRGTGKCIVATESRQEIRNVILIARNIIGGEATKRVLDHNPQEQFSNGSTVRVLGHRETAEPSLSSGVVRQDEETRMRAKGTLFPRTDGHNETDEDGQVFQHIDMDVLVGVLGTDFCASNHRIRPIQGP